MYNVLDAYSPARCAEGAPFTFPVLAQYSYSGPSLRVVTIVPFISLSFACFMKSLSPSMRTEI
jgi:hypothetical protein